VPSIGFVCLGFLKLPLPLRERVGVRGKLYCSQSNGMLSYV